MTTAIVTETRRNGNPLHERSARNRMRHEIGELILSRQRLDDVSRTAKLPATMSADTHGAPLVRPL
jgi:hypothetical protein